MKNVSNDLLNLTEEILRQNVRSALAEYDMIQEREKDKMKKSLTILKGEFGENIMVYNLLSWKIKLFLITSVPSLRTKEKSKVKISVRINMVPNRTANLNKRTYRNLKEIFKLWN